MITVAIIGSRPPKDDAPPEAHQAFGKLVNKLGVFMRSIPDSRGDDDVRLISGDGPGIDQAAEALAKRIQIDFDVRPARWRKYGKPAGMKRNPKVINPADVVVAFWDGSSPGTMGSLKMAEVRQIPSIVVYPDSPAPTWADVLSAVTNIHNSQTVAPNPNIG